MDWESALRDLVAGIGAFFVVVAVIALCSLAILGGSAYAHFLGYLLLGLGSALIGARLVVDRVLVRLVSRVVIRAFGTGFVLACTIVAPLLWAMGMPVASGIMTSVGLFSVVAATIET